MIIRETTVVKSLRLLTGKTDQGGGMTRWLVGTVLIFAVTVIVHIRAQGAIYFFVDENGVKHFTNVPDDPRYRLKYSAAGVSHSGSVNRFDSLIHHAARQHQVDPLLIKAIVRAESDFDPYAVSEKGAKGLMQLMPETAREMQVANPFDPEANLLGGTRFLKENLDRFNNDLELSLAAYNAGPAKIQATGRIPRIPETQNFVRKVLEFYQHYKAASRRRYGVR